MFFVTITPAVFSKESPLEKLKKCPSSPNCVSSVYKEDGDHYIKPWVLHANVDSSEAIKKIVDFLKKKENISIIKSSHHYVHVQVRTQIFKFVDDVEFQFNPDEKVLHIRSASQTGYYDFGANRKRLLEWKEALRESLVESK